MANQDFGKQLRIFRRQCEDPHTGKPLTQEQLGNFLYKEMGIHYTGAAISDWERNQSSINVNDRPLLINLINLLKRYGGIKTLADANLLLEAGNYRALNASERGQIFSEEIHEANPQPQATNPKEQVPGFKSLYSNIFFSFPEEFQNILDNANEGPPPAWPRIAVSLINRVTDRWSGFHVLRILAWFWIWLITYLLIAPSLQWPLASHANALQAMFLYAVGTIILPFIISAMIGVKKNAFWQKQEIPSGLMIYIYTYQGASIGFHLGYFAVFVLSLTQYNFQLQPVVWIEFIKMALPIVVGYTGAQLVPYNLWRAYGRLHLKDGGIFFIFAILGPVWAWFFLEFYEILITRKLGAIIILISITMLTGVMALQYRRKKNTVIPVLWWMIFYGLILICQIASRLIQ